jgi:methylmalonyl-CoA mutase N-terminal domain/subunit
MNEFLRCLEEMDVRAARRIWKSVAPAAHQPKDDGEMRIMLHRARTESEAVSEDRRCSSTTSCHPACRIG